MLLKSLPGFGSNLGVRGTAGTGLSLLEELENITIAANTTECGEFNHFGYLAHSIG